MVDAIARPRRQQLRDAAVLLLANATGLPTQVLGALRWDHVQFRRASLEVTVPPMPSRGPRPYSPLTVPAASGGCCPREALLRWRREAGPAQQPLFSLNHRSCDVSEIRPVVSLLGTAPSRPGSARLRLAGEGLEGLVAQILAPQPRAVRDRALLLLAFTAALGTDEARRLLQADVVATDRGLQLRLPGRAEPWTAVPASRHGAPCPADAWHGWQHVLQARGLWSPDRPAFTQLAGLVVKSQPLHEQGLNLIIHQDCAAAGLSGDWSFTSLRSGFIRTAIRAGAPEHVVGRQAGLTPSRASARTPIASILSDRMPLARSASDRRDRTSRRHVAAVENCGELRCARWPIPAHVRGRTPVYRSTANSWLRRDRSSPDLLPAGECPCGRRHRPA